MRATAPLRWRAGSAVADGAWLGGGDGWRFVIGFLS